MTPGDVIRKKLDDRGWTQGDLAKVLDRPLQSINQIVSGKKAITPETAMGLAAAFGDRAEEWLLAESKYRLALVTDTVCEESVRARAKLFDIAPLKEMEKRGWIRSCDSAEQIRTELERFFDVKELDQMPEIQASTRRSRDKDEMNAPQTAWCFRVRNLARLLPAAKFSPASLDKCVSNLRALAAWPEAAARVPEVLAEGGIRFVVVEHLAKSEIDGVALWLDENSPVIGMSVRRDRIDNFWHTLGHELSHLRHRDAVHVDVNLVGDGRVSLVELEGIELRAEREAADTWVPETELQSFILRVGPLYSQGKINGFASRIKIHPGIIVGQLQHRGEVSYDSHRASLVKIRSIVTSTAMTDGWGHSVEM